MLKRTIVFLSYMVINLSLLFNTAIAQDENLCRFYQLDEQNQEKLHTVVNVYYTIDYDYLDKRGSNAKEVYDNLWENNYPGDFTFKGEKSCSEILGFIKEELAKKVAEKKIDPDIWRESLNVRASKDGETIAMMEIIFN